MRELNRREVLTLLLIASLTPTTGVLSRRLEDSKVKSVTLDITHYTKILKPLKKVKMWIPIPPTDHAQEVSNFKVISPYPYRITEEKVWGNRSLFIERDKIGESEIVIKFRITRKREKAVKDPSLKVELCLQPSEWEVWNKEIENFTDKVTAGEKDPVKIAKKIYKAIIRRTKHIEGVCGRGVSILTFEQKIGRCDEFHALFRSMLMYKKIPVSWEEGLILPYPSELKDQDSYEADCLKTISWVRFYDGKKWIPADLAEAKKRPELAEFYFGAIPPNRIRLSRGRGFKLEPPQVEPLSLFAYTHIEEEDGIPAIYGHHYRNVLSYKLLDMEVEK